jgi:hypothetical protein
MIGRIEEGIDGRTVATPNAAAAAPLPRSTAADPGSAWSFSDLVMFLQGFLRTDSDPPHEAP